jgi:HlyD family secretion protein
VNHRSKTRSALVLIAIGIAAGGAAWLARGTRPADAGLELATQAAARHDIALTVEATGTVEPVDLVEVKSKASGTIVTMPVSVGSRISGGDLLVQIDARDVKNQYDQSFAARQAAQVKVEVSLAQRSRADSLYVQGIITAGEHEAALLDYAGAQAALITARTNLDLARQRLDDATVRAPVAGTVLSQSVTAGQVISSATSSVSGGTTLLTMADLSRIRMRAMVAEADVGNVAPGQRATVTVDAFPGRTFDGVVEKVEPQAVVEQSVTNFPVLVSLSNEEGLLLPGMNGEVSLVVDRKNGVLAVPVDAVRNQREALVLAATLGLEADSVKAALDSQKANAKARSADPPADAVAAASAGDGKVDSLLADDNGRHSKGGKSGGRKDGSKKHDKSKKDGGGSSPGSNRSQVVFVKSAIGIEPRRVKIGLSDYDFAQVISGVEEGEQVVLLGVAQAQAARADAQAKAREKAASRSALGTASGSGGSGGSSKGGGS